MQIKNNKKYLITTDNWFFAPDGHQYRAVWGYIRKHLAEDVLGVVPTRSTNWLLSVTNDNPDSSIMIAGCQIHYLVECPDMPTVLTGVYEDVNTKYSTPVNNIYIP